MFTNKDTLDLSPEIFLAFAQELILLFELTCTNNPETTPLRLVFAIETKFLALGLHNDDDPAEDTDSIHTFMEQVHASAIHNNLDKWTQLSAHLPFVNVTNPRYV